MIFSRRKKNNPDADAPCSPARARPLIMRLRFFLRVFAITITALALVAGLISSTRSFRRDSQARQNWIFLDLQDGRITFGYTSNGDPPSLPGTTPDHAEYLRWVNMFPAWEKAYREIQESMLAAARHMRETNDQVFADFEAEPAQEVRDLLNKARAMEDDFINKANKEYPEKLINLRSQMLPMIVKCAKADSPLGVWGHWRDQPQKELLVHVSIWYLNAVLLALLVLLARPLRKPIVIRNRRKRGQCVHCGYDLRGNTTPLCPECGNNAGAEKR